MRKMNLFSRWLLVAVIMLLIFGLSSISHLSFFDGLIPAEYMQFIKKFSFRFGNSGFFSYAVSPHPDYILHKLGHITLYGMLGFALYHASGKRPWQSLTIVAVFALSDELHQALVPGRSGRLGDVILDILSAGMLIYLASRRMQFSKNKDEGTD